MRDEARKANPVRRGHLGVWSAMGYPIGLGRARSWRRSRDRSKLEVLERLPADWKSREAWLMSAPALESPRPRPSIVPGNGTEWTWRRLAR
jgi:hypothetical protein